MPSEGADGEGVRNDAGRKGFEKLGSVGGDIL